MIYLDNAATSWPKPPQVAQTVVRFIDQIGANPGRAGHRRGFASRAAMRFPIWVRVAQRVPAKARSRRPRICASTSYSVPA